MLTGNIDLRKDAGEGTDEETAILHNLQDLLSVRGSGVSEMVYLGQSDTSDEEPQPQK